MQKNRWMEESTFWYFVDQLPDEHWEWVQDEIARIRVHDYDLEDVDFAGILNQSMELFGEC